MSSTMLTPYIPPEEDAPQTMDELAERAWRDAKANLTLVIAANGQRNDDAAARARHDELATRIRAFIAAAETEGLHT